MVSLSLCSILITGRTGLIIFIIGIISLAIINFSKTGSKMFVLLGLNIAFMYGLLLIAYLMLDENVVKYALPIFFSLSDDKSISAIISFYSINISWYELLFGKGVYSGNMGYLDTDVGFFKILTSIGLPAGLFLYSSIIYMATRTSNFFRDHIVLIILMLLFVAEIKEPLIFKGYSARFFWFLIGMGYGLRHEITIKNARKYFILD